MTTVNVTNFRKEIFEYLEEVIEFNETLNITTKKGNAVLISEEAYNGLIETLYLHANPKVREEIIEGINTPLEECLPEKEVEW